ncbi:MAG: ROK family protein [Bacillota bacterium]
MKRVAGDQSMVRINNQQLIIELVKNEGLLSRADLAKKLNMSKPTISTNIESLLKQGILKEIGEGDSMGGRKPILLEFNKFYKYVIGIDLSSEHVNVAVGNLNGEVQGMDQIDLTKVIKEEEILQELFRCIERLLAAEEIDQKDLGAITIASPGIVNEETGEFVLNPQFKRWNQLSLKESFEGKFSVKTFIKNDINLAALGESSFGAGVDYHNLAYISMGLGIGAGIIMNGELYEGSKKAAGEISYWVPYIQDVNGETKTIETYLSINGLLERVKKDLKNGQSSQLLELVDEKIDELDFQQFKKAVDQDDPYCIEMVRQSAKLMGVVIANVSSFLDLDVVIVGGEICTLGSSFINPIQEMVKKLTPFSTPVMNSALDNYASIYGAFVVALDYVFKHIVD